MMGWSGTGASDESLLNDARKPLRACGPDANCGRFKALKESDLYAGQGDCLAHATIGTVIE